MIETLVREYGIPAVMIGAGVEGEGVVFLGGVLAHRGLLVVWQVALAAAIGSFCADQIIFFLGRHAGHLRFVQRLDASKAMGRARGLLERYPVGFVLAFRFVYGMRIISPLLISRTRISSLRFLVLNGIAALSWAVVITAVGYLFGNAVETAFGHLRLHLHLIVALAALLLALVAVSLFIKTRLE